MKNNIKDLITGQHEIAKSRIANAQIEADAKVSIAKKAFENFKNGILAQAKSDYESAMTKLRKGMEKLEAKYMKGQQKLSVKAAAVGTIKDDIAEVESAQFNLE